MATQAVKWWLLTALLLHKVHRKRDVGAELIVTPIDTNVTVGSQVRLSCSTNSKKEVNWQYGEDLNSIRDVYIAEEGLGRQFEESGRHKMDINTTIGKYDLLISDVTQEDDGFYTCSEPGSWDTPPHARLTITDDELPAKVCRENVIATKGGDLGITFSACSPKPYLSHVPVGLSYSNDVYNFGKLLNNYADSGRFVVDIVSEGLILRITKILLSDAGAYTCRGNSGQGDRHNQELVVLDGMPTCRHNISDTECIDTPTEVAEAFCAVNYTGNCAPHLTWRYENGNKSSSKIQREFTCFNQTFSMAEMRSTIAIESGGWLICNIEDPSQQFQCNTSVVPVQCKKHQQIGASNDPTNNSSITIIIVVIAILLLVIGISATVLTYRRFILVKRQPNHLTLEVQGPKREMAALVNQ